MPRQPEADAEALAPGERSAPEPETDEPAPGAPTEATPGANAQPEPEREPEPVTVGRMVADALRRAGVRWAFTVPGESFLGLLDGRPGPVLLSFPEDLLDQMVPVAVQPSVTRAAAERPTDDQVREVLQLLASARRPVILAGGGVLRARTSNDLVHLAELLRVPIIAGWRRADVISNDHSLYLGMTGYGSPAVVRERLERADAIVVIGCRLSEITSFG